MNRKIEYIVLHCTATDQDVRISAISNYWKKRLGWKNPGYHYIIEPDGAITQLQPLNKASNGVRHYNSHSIHISYIGGKHVDDRTAEQKLATEGLVKALVGVFPDAEVLGHKDFPKVRKSCPRFDVQAWCLDIELYE